MPSLYREVMIAWYIHRIALESDLDVVRRYYFETSCQGLELSLLAALYVSLGLIVTSTRYAQCRYPTQLADEGSDSGYVPWQFGQYLFRRCAALQLHHFVSLHRADWHRKYSLQARMYDPALNLHSVCAVPHRPV